MVPAAAGCLTIRMTWLNAPSGKKTDRLPVRAAEHNVTMPAADGHERVSETCTVITTLLDHEAARGRGAGGLHHPVERGGDRVGEDKTTVTGAGNRTSGPVLRSGRPRLVIQEAWAWLAGAQLVRASEAASLRSGHAAARALRRHDQAGRHRRRGILHDTDNAIRSMTTTQVTAASSLEALVAAADAAARACLHTLSLPRTAAALRTHAESTPEIPARHRDQGRPSPENPRSPCSQPASTEPWPQTRRRGGNPAARGTARHPRRDTRAETTPAQPSETDSTACTEHKNDNHPGRPKCLNSLMLGFNAS